MNILAIDTATEYCSAALLINGEINFIGQKMTRGHSDHIIFMVDQLLANAGILLNQCDVVAFDRGPGSFTGIRIGVGVAQGLALGKDLPVVSVSSLHTLAQRCDSDYVATAIDARMQQIYSVSFKRAEQNQFLALDSESLIKPEAISLNADQDWTVIGSGWDRYGKLMKAKLPGTNITLESDCYPRAKEVVLISEQIYKSGGTTAPEFGFPEYIRNKVAN